jgi:acetyltransferase EpsM
VAHKLLIIGSGSQARYVIDIVRQAQCAEIVGIADIEKSENVGKRVNGVPIVCTLAEVSQQFHPDDCRVIVAYGNNRHKRDIVSALTKLGFQFASVISPLAYISPSARVGPGCIINPLATIMPNAQLGSHVIVHSQSVVEHDNLIGDYANIAPGVSMGGRVTVGEGSYIYTGANIIPKINVGKWATVAAGATVIRDVPDYGVVAGVPAQPI